MPEDFKLSTVAGKGYDSESGTGRELWDAVSERLGTPQSAESASFAHPAERGSSREYCGEWSPFCHRVSQ
jgi:hypothetical protein